MSGGKSKNKKTCVRKSINRCPNECRVNKNTRKCDRKSKIAKKQYPKTRAKSRGKALGKAKRKKSSRKTLLAKAMLMPKNTVRIVKKLPGETIRVVTKLPGKTAKVVAVIPHVAVKGIMTGVKGLESVGTSAIKSLPLPKGGTNFLLRDGRAAVRNKQSIAKRKKRPFIYSKTGDSKRLVKKADKGLFDNVIEDSKNMGDALPDHQSPSKGGAKNNYKRRKGTKSKKKKSSKSKSSKSSKYHLPKGLLSSEESPEYHLPKGLLDGGKKGKSCCKKKKCCKNKKGGSAWTNHVNDVWNKGKVGNKNYKFKQAMSDASKSWKKQKAG